MEFMSRNLTKSGILFFRKGDIAEPVQLRCAVSPSRDHPADSALLSFHILHLLMKIHESATFCQTGHSVQDDFPDPGAHFLIFFQRLPV